MHTRGLDAMPLSVLEGEPSVWSMVAGSFSGTILGIVTQDPVKAIISAMASAVGLVLATAIISAVKDGTFAWGRRIAKDNQSLRTRNESLEQDLVTIRQELAELKRGDHDQVETRSLRDGRS